LTSLTQEKRFEQLSTPLFETTESVTNVAQLASQWFNTHLVIIA